MIRFFLIFLFACNALFANEMNHLDPEAVAALEIDAWKAYYRKDRLEMVQTLQKALQKQFHISSTAVWSDIIPNLALAAYQFSQMPMTSTTEEYNKLVLPQLTSAYEGLKTAVGGKWDATKAAKYDLEWWILRRNSKTFHPENVGKKMAQLYRELYGDDDDSHFIRAAFLRASAARYHDLCKITWGKIYESDWQVMQDILVQSYKELLMGIQANEKAAKAS